MDLTVFILSKFAFAGLLFGTFLCEIGLILPKRYAICKGSPKNGSHANKAKTTLFSAVKSDRTITHGGAGM